MLSEEFPNVEQRKSSENVKWLLRQGKIYNMSRRNEPVLARGQVTVGRLEANRTMPLTQISQADI